MTEDYKAQLSIKFGRMGDMLNLRASSVEELATMANELADHAMIIVTSAEEFQGKATITEAFTGTSAVKAPAGSGDVCAHGVAWVERSGTSKAGKPYRAKFCQVENDPTLPKCAAVWLN